MRVFHRTYQLTEAMTHNLETLSNYFIDAFPKMDHAEQILARTIYQQLALGDPLSLKYLSETLDQTVGTIKEKLIKWGSVYFSETGDIIGFLGITISEMPHCMQMNGKTSYAWCAWDTLFIPELVDANAQVTSICATTNKTIILTVTPQGIFPAQSNIFISFLLPDEEAIQENVTTSFCHFVHFFSSKTAGVNWTNQNKGTFLLTFEEAFIVGKNVNAIRYSAVLS